MASSNLLRPSTIFRISNKRSHFRASNPQITLSFLQNNQPPFISKHKTLPHLTFNLNPCCRISKSSIGFLEKDETLPLVKDSPVKLLFWVFLWASVSVALYAFSPANAKAAAAAAAAQQSDKVVKSIKASSFGIKFANMLRGSGWPDEAVVLALATLPVIELRGAIPVGYWLQLKPILLTVLSVLGNMIPVPLIILYLKPVAKFVAGTSKPAARFLDLLFESAKRKAGPIEEFQWLGLMLFVAVPFPGTGAWTGAIIASILDIPFWSAVSANFFGVVLASLLVNMLVNIGLKYAIVACVVMFIASGFTWTVLGVLKRRLSSSP